eukprot:291281_1
MSSKQFNLKVAVGGKFNHPQYGDHQLARHDGENHQDVYECPVYKPIIKKIIKGKHNKKIKLATFDIKYPQNKHLLTLNLFIQPGSCLSVLGFECDFQMQFQCKNFHTDIVSGININFVLYCKDLNIECWRASSRFAVNETIGHTMAHKSFQMTKFKQWITQNKSAKNNYLIFGLLIINIQLMHHTYVNPNFSKIITLPTFDYNKRYQKFKWYIDRKTISNLKTYKMSQWFRSNIQNKMWYFVLYPMGDYDDNQYRPDCVQFAIDIVTLPRYIYGMHVYFNAVLLETYTHFYRVNCYYEPNNTCQSAALDKNALKCKDLLELNSITFEIEIYMFRPFKINKSKEIFVNYWDIHCDKNKIKTNPPYTFEMQG